MSRTIIQRFLGVLKLQKILGNICFPEQIFYRNQSLGAPDICSEKQILSRIFYSLTTAKNFQTTVQFSTAHLINSLGFSEVQIEKCDGESNYKMSYFRNTLNFIQNFSGKQYSSLCRGGHERLRYCGTELFSNGIQVILILTCGIAVSSSPACGFSSFCLTVFSKRRSFTVLRNCSLYSPV